MIIFLSAFLALLIQVDAEEAGNRDVFGALLVFVNVLLVLAVLITSWFATQQSVDDSREKENSFTIAKTMLAAEQYAASSARLSRERGQATTSLASSSVRPGPLPSDSGLICVVQPQCVTTRGTAQLRRLETRNSCPAGPVHTLPWVRKLRVAVTQGQMRFHPPLNLSRPPCCEVKLA